MTPGSRRALVGGAVVVVAAAAALTGWAVASPAKASPSARPARHGTTSTSTTTTPTTVPPTTTAPPPTTTTAPRPTTTAPPTTSVPTTAPAAAGALAAPAAGFVVGRVTIVGDSVLIDAQGPLEADIPGAVVDGAVSRQWVDGESVLSAAKAAGQLGAVVVIELGTNGPITSADMAAMMGIVSGASRVVLVTNHVPDWWQDPNNALMRAAAAQYPRVVVADWEALGAANPQWFYSDGTHLPIGGPGAQALARLIADAV